jgi:probable addiction module antidote protein
MTEKFSPYDPATALTSKEAIEVFLADAFETGDAAHIAAALGVVARAKGMAELAAETGLSREQLYRCLSIDGNPTLKTMLAVMQAIGISLAIAPGPARAAGLSG